MKTLYYSEKTRKQYETEKECLKAEAEYDAAHAAEEAAKQARKKDAEKVEAAFKEYSDCVKKAKAAIAEAEKKYEDAKNAFVKKYGSYHMTYTNADDSFILNTFDFDTFFNKILDFCDITLSK